MNFKWRAFGDQTSQLRTGLAKPPDPRVRSPLTRAAGALPPFRSPRRGQSTQVAGCHPWVLGQPTPRAYRTGAVDAAAKGQPMGGGIRTAGTHANPAFRLSATGGDEAATDPTPFNPQRGPGCSSLIGNKAGTKSVPVLHPPRSSFYATEAARGLDQTQTALR